MYIICIIYGVNLCIICIIYIIRSKFMNTDSSFAVPEYEYKTEKIQQVVTCQSYSPIDIPFDYYTAVVGVNTA